jgi:hypothetical protein
MIPPSRRSDRHYGVDRLPRVRATGITACLSNSGALEHAREMAAHESPRTTKVNDRARIGSPKSRNESSYRRPECFDNLPKQEIFELGITASPPTVMKQAAVQCFRVTQRSLCRRSPYIPGCGDRKKPNKNYAT